MYFFCRIDICSCSYIYGYVEKGDPPKFFNKKKRQPKGVMSGQMMLYITTIANTIIILVIAYQYQFSTLNQRVFIKYCAFSFVCCNFSELCQICWWPICHLAERQRIRHRGLFTGLYPKIYLEIFEKKQWTPCR